MYPDQYTHVQMQSDPTRDTCSSLGCSVFNLLCCFHWLGIPAIIFSCKAKDNVRAGQFEEAKSDAKIVKILNIVGICIGLVALLISIIYSIVIYTTPKTLVSNYG